MKLEEEPPKTPAERRRRQQIYMLLIVALLGAVGAGVLLASSIWSGWKAPDEVTNAVDADVSAIDPEKLCEAQSTYDSIRRELFLRAAQAGGGDSTDMQRIADFSLLRVEAASLRGMDQESGQVVCTGMAQLQLPPQITTADGMGSLSATIDYSVLPAPDENGSTVKLGPADGITGPLSTIRGAAPPPSAAPPPASDPLAPLAGDDGGQPANGADQVSPDRTTASPAFDCSNARTDSEQAICESPSLAALDRQMNAQFDSAVSQAGPDQLALLRSTRSRFLAYRDRCGTNACIAEAYRGRIREIRDIMNGDWQPPR